MAWSVAILKAIVLSMVSLISLICVSHIIAGWVLRKDFEMAVRIASFTMLVVLLDALLTLGATLVFVAKLRTTNDLFDMSSEIQSVGACLLGYLALIAMYFLVPANFQAFMTIAAMFVRYFATMWISNIQPIRALLTRRVGGVDDSVPWFPNMPWWSPSTRIVVGSGHSTLPRATTVKDSGTDGGWLDTIMAFPSLLRAFKEYCRKALCIEAAVDKYLKDGAPFEINICSKTKAAVLNVAKIESFQRFTLEEISQVLVPAAQEVSEMLKDNIYDKFCKTEEYKRVARSLEGTALDD